MLLQIEIETLLSLIPVELTHIFGAVNKNSRFELIKRI
jgi:hypothetical protein